MNTGVRGLPLLLLVALAVAIVTPQSEWFVLARDQPPQAVAESDFQLHWAAGQALRRGKNPWDPATVNAIGATTGRAFTPFCAANPLVVRLFGLTDPIDMHGAYARWLRVNVWLLVAAVVVLALALARASPTVGPAAALAVALGLVALNDGTWMGFYFNQTNVVTLLAVAGALWAGLSRRPLTEGLLLAVATAAKTSPALLIVVAALAGRGRTAGAALIASLLLAAFSVAWHGAEVNGQWLDMGRDKLGYAAQVSDGEFNNSLHDWNFAPNGVLSRAGEAAGWSPGTARAGIWALTIVVLVLLAWWARRSRRTEPDLLRQYALGIAAGFLVSSVTWQTHVSLAAIPAAWLVLASWRGVSPLLCGLGAAACLVLFLPLGSFDADLHQTVDILLKADACLLLFVVLVVARPGRLEAG